MLRINFNASRKRAWNATEWSNYGWSSSTREMWSTNDATGSPASYPQTGAPPSASRGFGFWHSRHALPEYRESEWHALPEYSESSWEENGWAPGLWSEWWTRTPGEYEPQEGGWRSEDWKKTTWPPQKPEPESPSHPKRAEQTQAEHQPVMPFFTGGDIVPPRAANDQRPALPLTNIRLRGDCRDWVISSTQSTPRHDGQLGVENGQNKLQQADISACRQG